MTSLDLLAAEIHVCRLCPRLADYLEESRQRYPAYWSRPVSGFGANLITSEMSWSNFLGGYLGDSGA